MANTNNPGEIPEIPEEIPGPEKVPEISPVTVPENPPLPVETPEAFPKVEPLQPDIPTEIPQPGK
ncbi:MAG: hypothetical protein H7Z13_05775 [Ferruginibacter sp.]|nr:hypothetical protein [Ferruginibacter sp.]